VIHIFRKKRIPASGAAVAGADENGWFDALSSRCTRGRAGSFRKRQNLENWALFAETIKAGVIYAGSENVCVYLDSAEHVDLELLAGGEALVGWGIGVLFDDGDQETVPWNGLEITCSGYDGDGSGAGKRFTKSRALCRKT